MGPLRRALARLGVSVTVERVEEDAPRRVPRGRPDAAPARQLAAGEHFYGDGGTIHSNGELDVEVHSGRVVAVWFRCSTLPFRQVDVNADRARSMRGTETEGSLAGVVFRERVRP